MISLVIISGPSVTAKNFPTNLGVALQVLTLLIFGFCGCFLVCMLIRQTRGCAVRSPFHSQPAPELVVVELI